MNQVDTIEKEVTDCGDTLHHANLFPLKQNPRTSIVCQNKQSSSVNHAERSCNLSLYLKHLERVSYTY